MKIFLRPVTKDDGTKIVKWRNSITVKNHCFDKRDISLEMNNLFYDSYIATGKYKQYIVERINEDFGIISYPIATVYLKDIDEVNHRCELCIFTSGDEEWNTESQAIAIKMLVSKAFQEFGIHKIYTYVFAENADEVELMQNAGFTIEAKLIGEAVNLQLQYVDVLRLSVISE